MKTKYAVVPLLGVALATGCQEPIAPAMTDLTMQIVGGNGQQGLVGRELPEPLVVRVLDARGRPVKGQLVSFRVTAGGGTMYAGEGLTNANGIAQDWWTLGPYLGDNSVEVRAVDPATGAKQNFGTFSATAHFPTFTLTVTAGSGRVMSNPPGIDCGTDCSEAYDSTTVVALTAIPDSGFVFVGWTGSCSGPGLCVVSMDTNRVVSAVYATAYTVTVNVTGTGFVYDESGGIWCPTQSCAAPFATGAVVALHAHAESTAVFGGWSGACSGADTVCTFTVGGNVSVGATFEAGQARLSVTGAHAYYYSSPQGIDCGSDCSEDYPVGTMVVVQVIVDPGYVFGGWFGCDNAGTDCIVTMTSTGRTVGATVTPWP
jgi:List-Bact-rpt repeat protein